MSNREGRWNVDAYARSFASLCEGTIPSILADTGGPLHLDVGCGTGALALAAARAGRSVMAFDPDLHMLNYARRRTRHIAVVAGALPTLPLPSDRFDTVSANFVINHLPDPRAGLAELRRVAKPGGRIAITIWTNQPTVQATLFTESLAAASARPVRGQRLPEHLDFERSVTGLTDLAVAQHLVPLIFCELDWTWTPTWTSLWSGITGGVAAIGQTYLAQNHPTQRRINIEMRTRAQHLEINGVLQIPSKAAYLVATK